MIATAWQLGSAQATAMRGCGCGHTRSATAATSYKSRRYSVTFGQLRRARTEHHPLERYGDDDGVRDPWGRPLDDTVVQMVNDWTYAGRGYTPYPRRSAVRARRTCRGTRPLARSAIHRQVAA